MHPKKRHAALMQARTIAEGAAGELASMAWSETSHQADLSQKNITQKVHRLFELLEVEFSEVSFVDLARALKCVFDGKVDSSEENVVLVYDRAFKVMENGSTRG